VPDEQWQSPETGIAYNQLMGYNTIIHNEENNTVIRSVLNPNAPTCRIRFRNNHYTLLDNRVVNGNLVRIREATNVVDWSTVQTDLQGDVARAYNIYLEGMNIRNELFRDENGAWGIRFADPLADHNISIIPPVTSALDNGYRRGKDPFTHEGLGSALNE
jgi:hypothetical protein